jgi:hypothetical protein
MTLTEKGVQVAWVASVIAALFLGMGLGWKLRKPKPVHEVSAPAQRQSDGSLVLEKKPDAEAKPSQITPKGSVVERIVYVTVQPKPPLPAIPGTGVTAPQALPSSHPCGPVRIDLTLYRNTDGTKRVVASSPDGDVTGGMDIPVEDARPVPKELKYSAGVVIGQSSNGDKAVGAIVTRDISFLRLGLEVTKNTYALPMRVGWEGRVSLSVRF